MQNSLLRKLKIKLLYDPVFPLLSIKPKKRKPLTPPPPPKNTCAAMYIVALFTIAKIWKQPKCPSVNEWIKKILYMYAMEYCSLHKERKLPFVTTWVDLEGIMPSMYHGDVM